MSVLARAGALFVRPEAAVATPRSAVSVPAPAVRTAAVLAAARDLDAAAGGVAARLRAAARSGTAVVCRAGALPRPRPSTPSATKLARRLAARDVPAVAVGALCRVALPEDPADAVRFTWRLIGALEVPLVLALPTRDDAFDDFLRDVDRLYLVLAADADASLADLALASLASLGPPAERVAAPATFLGRHRAALGLASVEPALQEATT